MKRDSDESVATAAAFEKELAVVRRLRWPNIKSRQLPMLTAAASNYPGDSLEDQIRALLLDLLDPVAPGEERVELEKRGVEDEGLLGRWIFGQPERFNSASRPDYPYRPATTKAPQRYAELAELRGDNKAGLMRAPRGAGNKAGPGWELVQRLIADLVDLTINQKDLVASDIGLAEKWANGSFPRECESGCIAMLKDPDRPLVIFGQPGNGKSVLAARIARGISPRVLVLRASPGRLGESRVLEFDLLLALREFDIDGRTWSGAALEHALRDALAKRPVDIALIFDDVPYDVVEELLPETLTVPVFVTARTPAENARNFRVDPYSETEAETAALELFPDASSAERTRLGVRVGRSPLAMSLAAKLVGAGTHSLEELCEFLLESPVSGIQILDHAIPGRDGIANLYRVAIAELADEPLAFESLRDLAWLTSQAPSVRDALDFMSGPSSATLAARRAALYVLDRSGLIALENDQVVLNDLTRLIVRELTFSELPLVATRFRERMMKIPPVSHNAGVVANEVRVADRFYAEHLRDFPWQFWVLDSALWLIFDERFDFETTEADGSTATLDHAWAIEITDDGLFQWSSDTQRRDLVPSDELKWFVGLSTIFSEVVYEWYTDGFPSPDDWRYPGTAAEDKFVHELIQSSARTSDDPGTVLTACGQAVSRSAHDGPTCPDCRNPDLRSVTAERILRFAQGFARAADPFGFSYQHHVPAIELASGAAWAAGELEKLSAQANYLVVAMHHVSEVSPTEESLESKAALSTEYSKIAGRMLSHHRIWHATCEELLRSERHEGVILGEALALVPTMKDVQRAEIERMREAITPIAAVYDPDADPDEVQDAARRAIETLKELDRLTEEARDET